MNALINLKMSALEPPPVCNRHPMHRPAVEMPPRAHANAVLRRAVRSLLALCVKAP